MKGNKNDRLIKMNRWIGNIKKSHVTCFDKFMGVLQKYKFSITSYSQDWKNSNFGTELSNQIKVAKRRYYGFFKNESLFQHLRFELNRFKIYA